MEVETQILFRESLAEQGELDICKSVFEPKVRTNLSYCKPRHITICRYSCLPYYEEVAEGLRYNSCKIINSIRSHRWIANCLYYDKLKSYMPKMWTDDNIYLADPQQQFIVKGATNSRKTNWKYMFAPSRKDALNLAVELLQDSLIGTQSIVYKEYVELKNFGYDITGIPIADEWRFFYLFGKLLCYGYYWSNHEVDVTIDPKLIEFANEISKTVRNHVNFFVLDIAKKKDGEPVLIEINDGQMAGLSNCDPKELYVGIKNAVENVRWDDI